MNTGVLMPSLRSLILLIAWPLCSPTLQADDLKNFKSFEVLDAQALETQLSGSPIPNTNFGPVYSTILSELQNSYQTIGEQQAREVLNQRQGFYLGGLNNVGYTFRKGFTFFDINVERQIAPDLFDDVRYIVNDKFEINIEASKLFGKLNSQGLIAISEQQLAAFAGITFKRSYRYVHFADNYEDALVMDLHKLFMSFNLLKQHNYLELEEHEILQREDFLSAQVGGVVVAPIQPGIGLVAGGLGKFDSLFKLEIQAVGEKEQAYPGERLRINYEKTKGRSISASLALEAEFLRFLRLTLLSYDFNYRYEESNKTYLSFKDEDIPLIQSNSLVGEELAKLVVGKSFDPKAFAGFTVNHELRQLERQSSRYMVLLYGGLRDHETEHIRLGTGEQLKTFFRHNFEMIKYYENIWSRLINSFFKSFLQINTLVNHDYSDTKKLTIEYKATENLLAMQRSLTPSQESGEDEALSLNFSREFYTAKTSKKSRKKKALELLDHLSGADPLAATLLQQDQLYGPLTLKTHATVKDAGVAYFNSLDYSKVQGIIKSVCSVHSQTIWDWIRNLFGGCRSKLNKSFDYYHREYAFYPVTGKLYQQCARENRNKRFSRRKHLLIEKCIQLATFKKSTERQEIPLWRLRDFAQTLHKQSENKIDLIDFFGLENVFLHGSFKAQSANGPFLTHFNEGAFRGLGVVDHYMRQENMRSPASVVVD